MVKVDTNNLKEMINLFSALQKKYELTTTNLFNTIAHTSEFWKDDRSVIFYNKILAEKNVAGKLLNNFKKRESIYQYIYKEYSTFGGIISCDIEQKEAILEKLNYGVEQLEIIVSRFNDLDISFTFGKRDFLLEQKKRTIQLKKNWENYRIKLRKFLEQVETIEKEVKRRTQLLEDMIIEEFIFE